jgi:hypothetical protein
VSISQLEAFFYQIHILLGGGYATLGLLLKNMQHIDHIGKAHGVDSSVGVTIEVINDFKDTRAFEPF